MIELTTGHLSNAEIAFALLCVACTLAFYVWFLVFVIRLQKREIIERRTRRHAVGAVSRGDQGFIGP